MNKKVLSSSYIGIESFLVDVEVDISNGLPIFSIIGLGDTAISESKDRIRTALKNSNFKLEPKKIIVNLSPAGIKKEGAHFDLPIAVGIMTTMGFIKDRYNILENYLFLGELSLTGEIKRVNGALNSVIFAKENGYKGVVLPFENYQEASLIRGVDIIPVKNLQEVGEFISKNIIHTIQEKIIPNIPEEEIDFSDVKGQAMAKRALEIAAAGKHNLILIGSPGSGKSMLCKRITTILPPLTEKETIESTKIYSIAGELSEKRPIINTPPFRAPHHTSTPISIIGGGKKFTPGEISLASNGVLFLDELGEFPRSVLESLRQPLEEQVLSISRAQYRVNFKTNFIFLAATNPCECGYAFEPSGRCTCTQTEINKYMKKISGPIMDRIDLHVEMRRLSEEELMSYKPSESSREIRERVIKARTIQKLRFGNEEFCNGNMTQKQLKKYCQLSEENKEYFKKVIQTLEISARGFDKILKVARTIADLAESKNIEKEHLMEALSFRKK
ncbi:YifB family Mg chelatase-like AAA ATPase [uncultured Fusobacterium sp.]|uniref:YifB family Mg chelatase-like AAA ATPase n=1 Tax=uncultured Fusobacterium sp. TaxID=159267 RepID=UPI0025D9FAB4|nr:YifB family Mg chelatase-like AAA ATPase [uncultured Fusobacterium sp.]